MSYFGSTVFNILSLHGSKKPMIWCVQSLLYGIITNTHSLSLTLQFGHFPNHTENVKRARTGFAKNTK